MQVNASSSGPDAPFSPFGGAGLSEGSLGKEDFMKLLVAQLANQDPMNPTNSTEFTAQLAQFSSLEQLVNVNRGLEMLAITQTAGTSAQVMSFIGKEIEFDADTLSLGELGGTDVRFELGADASEVSISIRDESGRLVRTEELGSRSAGAVAWAWDGLDDNGNALGEGTYTFSVAAKGSDGDTVKASTRSHGVVAGVVFEKGYPELVLKDGRKTKLGAVYQASAKSGE